MHVIDTALERKPELMHSHENPKSVNTRHAAWDYRCRATLQNPRASGGYRLALACSAELCAASASFADIAAVCAGVPQLGASLPSPQARGR